MVAHPRLPRRRFTVDQYHRMVKAGILREDDRVELIEGEIIEMAPIGDPHVICVVELTYIFGTRLGERARVSVQNPVRLSQHSEPQPDLAILRPPPERLRATPTPDDVLLLIEVSDTTFAYDRGIKLRLYALAGIPEVWIVDLKRRRLLIFREPDGPTYRRAEELTSGAATPMAFPDLVIRLDEVFG